MADPTIAPPVLLFGSAGPLDTDWYWLDLGLWLPPGDVVSSPVVTITPIAGDAAPLTVAVAAALDTGPRTFRMPSGIDYVSAGPRIMVKLTGGTVGNTYSISFTWSDSQGRTITRKRLLSIADK
jgi:hypothetical protein